jgi:DNA-binding XRE family transcriptional regulator
MTDDFTKRDHSVVFSCMLHKWSAFDRPCPDCLVTASPRYYYFAVPNEWSQAQSQKEVEGVPAGVTTAKDFGAVCKYQRKRFQLSQQALAQKVDLSQASINRIEKGLQNIRLELAYKIAKQLDILIEVKPK